MVIVDVEQCRNHHRGLAGAASTMAMTSTSTVLERTEYEVSPVDPLSQLRRGAGLLVLEDLGTAKERRKSGASFS